MPPPERAPCPFCPRPDVFPLPEPVPRPTRRARLRAPGLGAKSCSLILLPPFPSASHLLHFHQMDHLGDLPAHRRVVLSHHALVEAPQAQGAQGIPLVFLPPDGALLPRDL